MSTAAGGSAQGAVRRIIVFVLLFVLVTIAAVGVGGLLDRAFDVDRTLAGSGADELALQLAFALIGGPLAALLWWGAWRRLGEPAERGSIAWPLYLAAMATVSLIVASTSIAGAITSLVDGRWNPGGLAIGLLWALVWLWHRWMLRHPVKGPTRLASAPLVIGAAYGLVVGAGGAISALAAVFDAAILGASETVLVGRDSWGSAALDGLVWAAIGAVVWWWHWIHDGVRRIPSGFAAVALVVVGVLGGGAAMLGGIGTVLFVGLRLAFAPSEPASAVLVPLGTAIAAAGVGALVWLLHSRIAAAHSDGTRRAAVLVMSGLGLVAAASGIGVVVNALLAELSTPLASSGNRALLLGGLSAIVVGGPTWWLNWRPTRRPDPADAADVGRRIYLVAVFGASAVVAIITLLVVGYRVFEFVLDPGTGFALVDRIRAPLGLLVATALVFAYHFAVWRRDRAMISAAGVAPARRIGRVVLVAAGATDAAERAIAAATGASVVVWRRAGGADGGVGAGGEPAAAPAPEAPGPDAAAVVAALDGVTAPRALVLVGPDGRIEAIPLAD
ncbi:hypothetical protein GCM10017608_05960 [Agromyces luteolus]|uniref:DUF5671 domain-containing protein n=1 Tax=Agromyces luteolus TaxID=88373 RepID=A0A7C9HGJ4_9MICO|nr:DUF5671 domain-containing protein [Agromyces luteolus]MUN06303.1 hypothetical protein [Agromyces luteolus]GLK26664.1 hypothetical protein GCM10017608_05960 [Agromyces luteolus]